MFIKGFDKTAESDPSQYRTPDAFSEVELLAAVRQDMQAELDAINLYEAHRAAARDPELTKVLDHIVKEEKEHHEMLQKFLNRRESK